MGYEKLNKMANLAPVGSNGLAVFPFGNGAERMLDNKIVNGHIKNINFNIMARLEFDPVAGITISVLALMSL